MALRVTIPLPDPHPHQAAFINSPAKRKIVRAGRRGGKTIGMAILAVESFLQGRRVLYGAPTQDQVGQFWSTVKNALQDAIDAGAFYKNETKHIIELAGTKQRIKAKTCWNAETLRGDYADLLILDEFQLMSEDTWGVVGAPMLMDNDGNAVFIYTPPSIRSAGVTKAQDPRHASKMFKRAQQDPTGRWATFHFSSRENPHISQQALDEIAGDMSALAYRMEILAEDVDEAPGALWKRDSLDANRLLRAPERMDRVVVAIDPSATSTGDEAGIIGAGAYGKDFYALEDGSIQGSPLEWGRAAIGMYYRLRADRIVAEANNGGEMVELTLKTIDPTVPVTLVHASRNKVTRAEPVAAIYEQNRAHHVGNFHKLEDEMCLYEPGQPSPNRMDALVWAGTHLMLGSGPGMNDWISALKKRTESEDDLL